MGLFSKYPNLLEITNTIRGYEGRNGLYYAIKNLRLSTINCLVSKGLKIEFRHIHGLVYSTWYGSPQSYKMLKDLGPSIYGDNPLVGKDYIENLFVEYRNFCFNHNDLSKLYKILEIEGVHLSNEVLSNILSDYMSAKGDKSNPAYLANIRDLQLRIIL